MVNKNGDEGKSRSSSLSTADVPYGWTRRRQAHHSARNGRVCCFPQPQAPRRPTASPRAPAPSHTCYLFFFEVKAIRSSRVYCSGGEAKHYKPVLGLQSPAQQCLETDRGIKKSLA